MDMKMEKQIDEAYKHIKPYLEDKQCTEDLREMCKHCEHYCGMKHDYEHCKDMMCFKFYLCYVYLGWTNSSDGY